MRTAVIVFPGSNCDRDLARTFEATTGKAPDLVWHKDTALPAGVDLIGLPGGFSYGDYLRCGAIAAQSPIMRAVVDFANRGGHVMGICNGFQVLQEAGLLPGALMRNAGLNFVHRSVNLRVETNNSPFTCGASTGDVLTMPVAHHDGNFYADTSVMKRLTSEDRIAFRYCDATGAPAADANPNGSMDNIAGILSENRRVLGMMPHPERASDATLGGSDGAVIFRALTTQSIAAA